MAVILDTILQTQGFETASLCGVRGASFLLSEPFKKGYFP
jgi:hypothetical protein